MRQPLGILLIVKNVKITGPQDSIVSDLVLDTGAVFTTLSCSILTIIGYNINSVNQRQEIITASGIITVPKLKIKSITIAELVVDDVEVICHDLPPQAGIRGLLGLSFLKHFKTTMDCKSGYLEIE